MKKIYSVFILLIFYQISSAQQWTMVGNAFPAIARGLFFLNTDTGYAVGEGGYISKTTDGGVTWTPQTSGVTDALRSVFFVNDTLGYISGGVLGVSGRFLKTIDGGATWSPMTFGTSLIRAVNFISPDTGLLAGSAGTIYKTTDGGTTWNSISLGITGDVIQLRMSDANIGYAVAAKNTFDSGRVFNSVAFCHVARQPLAQEGCLA